MSFKTARAAALLLTTIVSCGIAIGTPAAKALPSQPSSHSSATLQQAPDRRLAAASLPCLPHPRSTAKLVSLSVHLRRGGSETRTSMIASCVCRDKQGRPLKGVMCSFTWLPEGASGTDLAITDRFGRATATRPLPPAGLASTVGVAITAQHLGVKKAASASLQWVPSTGVDVRDYGAVGDGVTDDYDAIQAAISACGVNGGTVVFPPGTYLLNKPAAGGLKLPAGNMKRLVLSGYGATIKLSANVPRFLDFDRTADYQTFAHFWVEGFSVDANNVGGFEHVVGFTYIHGGPLARLNVDDIVVRDIHAYNILTDTAWPGRTSCREGLVISTHQWSRAEAITDTIRGVFIENVRLQGGNVGFAVGGSDYSGDRPADPSIEIDDVHLHRCSWDSGVRAEKGWPSNGMHLGWEAKGGSLCVRDCVCRGSGDNNFEVNAWHHALLENCVSEDANNVGYFFENYSWPTGHTMNGQTIIWRNCVHRQISNMSASRGWAIGTPSATHPVGTLDLEGCSVYSTATDVSSAGFFSTSPAKVRGIVFRHCTYYGTGMHASSDSWPVVVSVRCSGSPGGGPSLVTIEDCQLYFRSARMGAPAYVVRLVDIGGYASWSVQDCLFDATITDGAGQSLRILCLGDALPSEGSGVVDHCTFRPGGLEPWAVVVGDSSRLTVTAPLTVENCDFQGVVRGSTDVYVTPGDINKGKVRMINNTYSQAKS